MERTTIKQGNSKGTVTSYFFSFMILFCSFTSRIYNLLSINLSKISGNKFAGVYYINILLRRPHTSPLPSYHNLRVDELSLCGAGGVIWLLDLCIIDKNLKKTDFLDFEIQSINITYILESDIIRLTN